MRFPGSADAIRLRRAGFVFSCAPCGFRCLFMVQPDFFLAVRLRGPEKVSVGGRPVCTVPTQAVGILHVCVTVALTGAGIPGLLRRLLRGASGTAGLLFPGDFNQFKLPILRHLRRLLPDSVF